MYQIRIIDDQGASDDSMEFRTTYNKTVIGNVYTGFRKPYHDFGLFGVIFLQIMLAIIFNILYYNSFYKKEKNIISVRIIITAALSFCLILHSFSEAFYCNVLSFNYLMFFTIIVLIVKFIEKVR